MLVTGLDQAVGRLLLRSHRFDFIMLNSYSYSCTVAGYEPAAAAGEQPQPTPLQADISTLPILTDKGGQPLHIFTLVSENDLD